MTGYAIGDGRQPWPSRLTTEPDGRRFNGACGASLLFCGMVSALLVGRRPLLVEQDVTIELWRFIADGIITNGRVAVLQHAPSYREVALTS